MKKLLIVATILLGCMVQVSAKEEQTEIGQEMGSKEWRRGYLNLCWDQTTLTPNEANGQDSKYGGAITFGRTFFLHKPVIKESLRFGIDITFFDLNYENFRREMPEKTYQAHKADFSLHVGPSVTIGLGKRFKIFGYFRYSPTFTCLYDMVTEDIYGNYATMFVGGGALSYGPVGLGAEARFGSTTYKPFTDSKLGQWDASMNGWRAYLSFRL